MGVNEKGKTVSSTDLYIKIIQKQIEWCNNYPSKYGILHDKGFKDGLQKSINIILKVKEEVKKNEK